ncbi:unnamed protein product [Leptosia nina]|uniref:Secreted protein n=1 Tax=Leptosia nina TaxID=320188 RepID=A0AAV1JRG9_9NEOP
MKYAVLLLLLTTTIIYALPVPDEDATTPVPDIEVVEIIDFVPVVIPLNEATTEAPEDQPHDVQKRSAEPMEIESIDLVGESEIGQADDLSSLDRRIKTLPTWVG